MILTRSDGRLDKAQESRRGARKEGLHGGVQARGNPSSAATGADDGAGGERAGGWALDLDTLDARVSAERWGGLSWARAACSNSIGGGNPEAQAGAGNYPSGAGHPQKGDGLLCQGITVRYRFIEQERRSYPVGRLCQVLRVSRSGAYARRL